MFEHGNNEADAGHFTAINEDWQYIDGVDIAYYQVMPMVSVYAWVLVLFLIMCSIIPVNGEIMTLSGYFSMGAIQLNSLESLKVCQTGR